MNSIKRIKKEVNVKETILYLYNEQEIESGGLQNPLSRMETHSLQQAIIPVARGVRVDLDVSPLKTNKHY